jgi:hypothetical protein
MRGRTFRTVATAVLAGAILPISAGSAGSQASPIKWSIAPTKSKVAAQRASDGVMGKWPFTGQTAPRRAARPARAPKPAPGSRPSSNNSPRSPRTPFVQQTRQATSIAVCCAWSSTITDGLTYSISAPNGRIHDVIKRGVLAWLGGVNSARGVAHALALQEVPSFSPADIQIRFDSRGGNVQGETRRDFDFGGFLTHAQITVFGSHYGQANSDTITGQIAKHEFGHALGADHANGDGEVMSPAVIGGSESLTACDIVAVVAAQNWFMVRGLGQPEDPRVGRVSC